MTFRSKIWFVVILICLVLTIWLLPCFLDFWRIYVASKPFESVTQWGQYEWKEPVIDEITTETDREAADITNWLGSDRGFDELNKLAEKYPESEFIHSQLVDRILAERDVNPKAASLIVDRFAAEKGNDAYWHYLRAGVLAHPLVKGNFKEVLREIEKANSLDVLVMPFDQYKQRIKELFLLQGTPVLGQLHALEPPEYSLYRVLGLEVNKQALEAFRESKIQQGRQISSIGLEMSGRFLKQADTGLEGLIGWGVQCAIHETRLKHAELSEAQIKQTRFDMASIRLLEHIFREETGDILYVSSKCGVIYSSMLILCWWAGVFVVSCLIAWTVGLARGLARECKISWKQYLLFPLSILALMLFGAILNAAFRDQYDISVNMAGLRRTGTVVSCVAGGMWLFFWLMSLVFGKHKKVIPKYVGAKTLFCVMMFVLTTVTYNIIFWGIADVDVILVSVFILLMSGALWLLLMYGWWMLRHVPYKWFTGNRIVQLLLLSVFCASLVAMCQSNWSKAAIEIIFILCVLSILVFRPSEKLPALLAAPAGFWGRSAESRENRRKFVRLLMSFVIVLYIGILSFLWVSGPLSRRLIAFSTQANELAQFKPFPEASQATYDNMIEKLIEGEIQPSSTVNYLSAVMPEDLERVVTALKNTEFEGDYTFDDYDVVRVIISSASDSLDILTELASGADEHTLQKARAQAGDTRVRVDIEILFDKNLKALSGSSNSFKNPDRALSECLQLAELLANIGDVNAISEKLLNLIELLDNTTYDHTSEFCDVLEKLDADVGKEVLKAYLDRTGYRPVNSKNALNFSEILPRLGDEQIAKAILNKIMEGPSEPYPETDIEIIARGITEFFSRDTNSLDDGYKVRRVIAGLFDESSVGLLKKGLKHEDEGIRAFSVWQLDDVGYEWEEGRLEDLLKDKSWKVRANTVIARGKDAVVAVKDDDNSYVRTVARLVAQSN